MRVEHVAQRDRAFRAEMRDRQDKNLVVGSRRKGTDLYAKGLRSDIHSDFKGEALPWKMSSPRRGQKSGNLSFVLDHGKTQRAREYLGNSAVSAVDGGGEVPDGQINAFQTSKGMVADWAISGDAPEWMVAQARRADPGAVLERKSYDIDDGQINTFSVAGGKDRI